jgi:hypothetical protein
MVAMNQGGYRVRQEGTTFYSDGQCSADQRGYGKKESGSEGKGALQTVGRKAYVSQDQLL